MEFHKTGAKDASFFDSSCLPHISLKKDLENHTLENKFATEDKLEKLLLKRRLYQEYNYEHRIRRKDKNGNKIITVKPLRELARSCILCNLDLLDLKSIGNLPWKPLACVLWNHILADCNDSYFLYAAFAKNHSHEKDFMPNRKAFLNSPPHTISDNISPFRNRRESFSPSVSISSLCKLLYSDWCIPNDYNSHNERKFLENSNNKEKNINTNNQKDLETNKQILNKDFKRRNSQIHSNNIPTILKNPIGNSPRNTLVLLDLSGVNSLPRDDLLLISSLFNSLAALDISAPEDYYLTMPSDSPSHNLDDAVLASWLTAFHSRKNTSPLRILIANCYPSTMVTKHGIHSIRAIPSLLYYECISKDPPYGKIKLLSLASVDPSPTTKIKRGKHSWHTPQEWAFRPGISLSMRLRMLKLMASAKSPENLQTPTENLKDFPSSSLVHLEMYSKRLPNTPSNNTINRIQFPLNYSDPNTVEAAHDMVECNPAQAIIYPVTSDESDLLEPDVFNDFSEDKIGYKNRFRIANFRTYAQALKDEKAQHRLAKLPKKWANSNKRKLNSLENVMNDFMGNNIYSV